MMPKRRLPRSVQLGAYAITAEGAATAWRMWRTARRRGASPPRFCADAAETARLVLRANAGAVLRAGRDHFHGMWVADVGKAIRGARLALPAEYLEAQVARMAHESARLGRVPVVFGPTRASDVPWPRADGAPWLLHAAHALGPAFVSRHAEALGRVYEAWARRDLDDATGVARLDVRGDWMDTVRRPSSTYNAHCALHAHRLAASWSWPRAQALAERAEDHLLHARLQDGSFVEDARGGPALAADANALPLYFDELPREILQRVAARMAPLMRPFPMRVRDPPRGASDVPAFARLAGSYHETIWTHLGWMACVGLRRQGLPWREAATPLVASVAQEGTFVETLDEAGRPFASRFVASERDFTMSAGLGLELLS